MSSSEPPSTKRTKMTHTSSIELKRQLTTEHDVCCLAFSPNGMLLASASIMGFIYLWDVLTGTLVVEIKVDMTWIHALVYTPDYKSIISGSNRYLVQLWNASTGELETTLQGHTNTVRALAISKDGQTLYSGSDDRTIRVWNLRDNNTCFAVLTGHYGSVRSLTITPGFIISGSSDRTVKYWSRTTGECIRTINDHTGWVLAVASYTYPDGSFLFASGSYDWTIKLYDDNNSSLSCIRTLRDHTNSVRSLSFNLYGSLLASGSDDKTIKIWDVSSGKCLQTLSRQHTDRIHSVLFSPDESRLVSGSDDKTICIWSHVKEDE